MKVNLTKIRQAIGRTFDFRFSEKLEPMRVKGEDVFFTQPADVEISLTNTGRIFHVKGKIVTAVKVTCSRCLGDFEEKLDIDMEENFISSFEAGKDKYEGLDPEEITVVTGEELDLKEKVIENIILSLPMKALCTKDCKGICSECGINLNEENCSCEKQDVDPRLEVLKKFLKS